MRGVETVDEVRAAGRPLVGFSDEIAVEERELKQFLYSRLYGSPELERVRVQAQRVVSDLAGAYRADPALLPPQWQRGGDEIERTSHHRRLHRRDDRPFRHRPS